MERAKEYAAKAAISIAKGAGKALGKRAATLVFQALKCGVEKIQGGGTAIAAPMTIVRCPPLPKRDLRLVAEYEYKPANPLSISISW